MSDKSQMVIRFVYSEAVRQALCRRYRWMTNASIGQRDSDSPSPVAAGKKLAAASKHPPAAANGTAAVGTASSGDQIDFEIWNLSEIGTFVSELMRASAAGRSNATGDGSGVSVPQPEPETVETASTSKKPSTVRQAHHATRHRLKVAARN